MFPNWTIREQPGRLSRLLLLAIFIFAPRNGPAVAQWTSDVYQNTPISVWQGERFVEDLLSDSSGGAFIVWADYSNFSPAIRVLTQRVSADGYIRWQDEGVRVSLSSAYQLTPQMCSDGSGGFIIAWVDTRFGNEDIFAQRISPDGNRLWGDNGVAITTADFYQDLREITPDGNGGALIVWKDGRYTIDGDIFAQKVDSNGIVQWTTDGTAVCVISGENGGPDIVSDGAGGAFVVWDDNRPGAIYMQHLDAMGMPLWSVNGIQICKLPSCGGGVPEILNDETGGSIVIWKKVGIHAQRVTSAGNILWGTGGIQIMDSSGYKHKIATDGRGGVIVTTGIFLPSYYRTDVYAQRIASDGTLPWGFIRTAICTTHTSDNSHPRLVADGDGGAIITWGDLRNDSIDVYAQRVDSLGNTVWESNGVPVSLASRTQQWPFVVSDGRGGGIFSWYVDNRHGLIPPGPWYDDIYIQNLDRYGYPGVTTPSIDTVADVSTDQGGFVRVTWKSTYLDRDVDRVVTAYAVYRWFDSLSTWQWMVTVQATSQPGYTYQLSTLIYSTKGSVVYEKFIVQAINLDSSKIWTSAIDSGYSVDNLAPSSVAALSAELAFDSTVRLHWPPNLVDHDIRSYLVYREDSSNVLLPPIQIASATDTVLIDSSYEAGVHSTYFVIVEDIHDNRSPPSPEVVVTTETKYSFTFPTPTWRLLSIPLASEEFEKDSIFPGTAGLNAYRFDGSYWVVDSLHPGWGFWLKMPSSDTFELSGYHRLRDTVPLSGGWNLIGSLSKPLPVSQVESVPPGMIVSRFFGYNGTGYFQTDTLFPGGGYWVNAGQEGSLILSATPVENQPSGGTIRIRPTSETPPPPKP